MDKILIVDDEMKIIKGLSRVLLLRDMGCSGQQIRLRRWELVEKEALAL